MNTYDTNIKTQSCSCLDWLERRSHYSMDDPRRLCKHLINDLDINNLDSELRYFKEKIEYCKKYEKGFSQYINKIIYLKEADCKVLIQDGDWYGICDSNGIEYGFSIYYNWSSKGKPLNFGKIEEIIFKLIGKNDGEFLEAIGLFEDEKLLIKKLVENQGYKNVSFEIATEFMTVANQLIYTMRYFDKDDIHYTNEYIESFVDITNEYIKFSNMETVKYSVSK